MFKLHQDLCKTKSFLIIQICFNHINLTIFLNKIKISDYKSFTCWYSQAWETITYIISHCSRFIKIRYILKFFITNQLNIQILTNMTADIQHLIRWFIKLWILSQFQLTKQLLYKRKKIDELEKTWSDSKII